ncbi:hypothetical protein FQZ97_1014840 [compost metagenome]
MHRWYGGHRVLRPVPGLHPGQFDGIQQRQVGQAQPRCVTGRLQHTQELTGHALDTVCLEQVGGVIQVGLERAVGLLQSAQHQVELCAFTPAVQAFATQPGQ